LKGEFYIAIITFFISGSTYKDCSISELLKLLKLLTKNVATQINIQNIVLKLVQPVKKLLVIIIVGGTANKRLYFILEGLIKPN
jgi:hypothetical protein